MTHTSETTANAATRARTGGRIVVGVDGSDASIVALRRAIRIADSLDATVEVVTSWHYPVDYGDFGGGDAIYSPADDAKSIGEDASRAVWDGSAPAWFSLASVEGFPADALIERSRGAEMLVVGSRGHSGIAGVLLGSVSAKCAERASCPVLVVH